MDQVMVARARRNWPLIAAGVMFLLFIPIHLFAFQPTLQRYQRAVKAAGDLGVGLDPTQTTPMMPARVFALLSDNSLPAATADQQGGSGELTASLIDDVSRIASRHGMEVLATEPGSTVRTPSAVQTRAHIRANCAYGEFVAFLDELSHNGRLISVDRFSLTAIAPGRRMLDLWASRYVLKQTGTAK